MHLSNATGPQALAITSRHDRILALAGPGSGKTATTVARINYLIDDGADPAGMVVITFTNAAAREIEKRLYSLEGTDPEIVRNNNRLGYVGTLHGFALRMLKEHGAEAGYGARMSIISPESANDLLASIATTLGCKTKLAELLKLKGRGRPERSARLTVEQTVIASYYQQLAESGIVDFDLLLTEFARLVAAGGTTAFTNYTHLFVDEVQDSAPIDWEIYHALPIANKFFVGDPDQAIYGFRGGDVNGMMALSKRPDTELIVLEENFRSHSEICDAAQRLISHNQHRLDKITISAKGPGGEVTVRDPLVNEGEEHACIIRHLGANSWLWDTIAVLCRTNDLAYQIQQALITAGLPVVKRERSTLPADWPVARALVELLVDPNNDTLAYFYLIALYRSMGSDEKAARKHADAVRKAAASIGKTINQANLHLANNAAPYSRESGMLLAEIIRTLPTNHTPLELALAVASYQPEAKEEKHKDGIHVLTIHASKGREFDAVYLAGFEDEIIPGTKADEQEVEEERRLAYVAITRARKFLMITSASQRTTPWGKIVPHTPSRFITELVQP